LPTYELKIVTHFAAAHQLKMVARKCENLHGHNWKVEVRVVGDELDEAGILMDFGVLKKHVAEVMDTLDHKFLNETDLFDDACPPSSENIARYIARYLDDRLADTPARVSCVSAWESENACATYIP
jgi:6-pyruvoyltetrahydropterin/6-carboxytetrahydropterin synthase